MATQRWVAILRLRARKLAHQEDPPWQLKTPTPPVATIAPHAAAMPAVTPIAVRVRTGRGRRDDPRGVALLDPTTVRAVTTALRAATGRTATVRARPTVTGRVATRRGPIPVGVRPRVGRTVLRTVRTAMRGPCAMVVPRRRDVRPATAHIRATVDRRAVMTAVAVRRVVMTAVVARRVATTVAVALVAVDPRAAPGTAERVGEAGRRRPTVRHVRRSVSARAAPNSPKTSPRAICLLRRAMS
ncbi:hypothetical protein DEU34_3011 [Microbacterium sp. AG1240]|nr:hypothetical protein DEU34_3011 [Microbacterium sp. AG1240]